MNQQVYYNYIEEKLTTLATRINIRGKLNILDLHNHSEEFYLRFFNLLFELKLENLNTIKHNVEAIDLLDDKNKVLIQVSSTATKEKIESSLSKESLKNYSDYNFKFISIAIEANKLREKIYKNPQKVIFDPRKDIYDNNSILNRIKTINIKKQKEIYQFIKEELGTEPDIVKLDSNLASLINILSEEDWDKEEPLENINSYEIEKKISINNLDEVKSIIDDYKIHYNRVDKIYTEFNKQGKNKSSSVLNSIRKQYLELSRNFSDIELFLKIIDSVIEKSMNSKNFQTIPIDELELCVNILVVDAFIRCKIFKNPENYNYVIT